MLRSSLCFMLILMALTVALTEGAPKKPKKVKCQDKWYRNCYHKDLFCPKDCLQKCYVDCARCQAVCTLPPPSPSPPPPRQRYRRRSPPPPSPPPPPPRANYPPPPPPLSTPPSTIPAPPRPPSPPTTSSPPLPQPPPPLSEAAGGKRVRCRNRNFTNCYGMEHTCPNACPDQCEVDCVTCSPVCNCNRPGAVCQDPRFVGGDGITFYFHGKKDRHFCLVSDSNLHINALFIGKRSPKLTRDFTWVQSLGILFGSHNLSIAALKTPSWNDAVDRLFLSLDGLPVSLPALDGASWTSPSSPPRVAIRRVAAANAVEVEVADNFLIRARAVPITAEDSRVHGYGIVPGEDCFAHLDVGFKFYALSGDVSGVLGQTYGKSYVSRVKMGVAMPVLGGDREFAASGLFAADCVAAKFRGESRGGGGGGGQAEAVGMDCASSGVEGRGVVCRR